MLQARVNTIYYFFDPHCGWCYGFSNIINNLYQKFGKDIYFQPVCGGMIRGEREGAAGPMADHIERSVPQVSQATGAVFGEPYMKLLRDPNAYFSSGPPSMAIHAFMQKHPHLVFLFIAEVQKAVFQYGQDLNNIQTYAPILAKAGMTVEEFLPLWQSQNSIDALAQDYEQTKQWGIQGFPTMILASQEGLFALNRGFRPYEQIDLFLTEYLKNDKKVPIQNPAQ